jgi:hypothetical protein
MPASIPSCTSQALRYTSHTHIPLTLATYFPMPESVSELAPQLASPIKQPIATTMRRTNSGREQHRAERNAPQPNLTAQRQNTRPRDMLRERNNKLMCKLAGPHAQNAQCAVSVVSLKRDGFCVQFSSSLSNGIVVVAADWDVQEKAQIRGRSRVSQGKSEPGNPLELRQESVELSPVVIVLCEFAMLAGDDVLRVWLAYTSSLVIHTVYNAPRQSQQTCPGSSRNIPALDPSSWAAGSARWLCASASPSP